MALYWSAGGGQKAPPTTEMRSLLSRQPLAAEGHIAASGIEPVPAFRASPHPQRHGPLQSRIFLRGHRQHVVAAHVGHHKFVARDESHAINAGSQLLPAHLEGNLRDEPGLVLGDSHRWNSRWYPPWRPARSSRRQTLRRRSSAPAWWPSGRDKTRWPAAAFASPPVSAPCWRPAAPSPSRPSLRPPPGSKLRGNASSNPPSFLRYRSISHPGPHAPADRQWRNTAGRLRSDEAASLNAPLRKALQVRPISRLPSTLGWRKI